MLGPILENSFGDRYLYDVNGSGFDKVGSLAAYEQHFDQDLFAENYLHFVIGSDCGLLPRFLLERGVPSGSYYIFIEPEEVLESIAELIPEGGFHPRVKLTTATQWQAVAEEVNFQNFVYLGNMRMSRSFAALDGRYLGYLEIGCHMQEELEKLHWQLRVSLGAEVFLKRQLENLPENRHSASLLKGLFAGKVALVAAGGPSLDEALPWICEHRDRFVFIAVSRIARRLIDVGLTPDICVSIDPHDISFDISKEMLSLWETTFFVNMYHVSSKLLGQWQGRSLFLDECMPWESDLNEGIMKTTEGPTVTNNAIDLAVQMGCSQVLLAGVDLCHSQEGFTHALGSNERKVGPQLGRGQLWVKTNGGWNAETTPDLYFASKQIALQAKSAVKQGCCLVNLSENALEIKGVRYCAVDQIDFDPLEESVFTQLCRALPDDNALTRVAWYRKVIKALREGQNQFRAIRKLSVDALKANDAFFNPGKQQGNPKHRIRMDQIERKLNGSYSVMAQQVKKNGILEFLKITEGSLDRTWDRGTAEKIGRLYYEAYRDSAGRLIAIVDDAVKRLDARIEEEQPSPDFERMAQQWCDDGQPGRGDVWLHKHPEAILSTKAQKIFTTLREKYAQQQSQEETAHLKRVRSWSQLGQTRGKMQIMYRNKDIDALSQMIANLDSIASPKAFPLLCLGRGYQAELNGDQVAAIDAYNELFNCDDMTVSGDVLEEVLRRLLALTLRLDDHENARLISECLAHISVTYLPNHADLLWLLGEQKTALDLYADYLAQVPGDLIVMIKVGRYYQELGVTEGARMMFEEVLAQDPTHTAASVLLKEIGNT